MTTITAFHGTGRNFNEFDKAELSSNHDFENEGFFFITDLEEATWYANDNKYDVEDWSARVITAELIMENPLILNAKDDSIYSNPTNYFDKYSEKLYNTAYNDEYDGIIINGVGEYAGTKLIVVFENNQIEILEDVNI